MRKRRPPLPDKGEPTVLDLVNGWTSFTVYGRVVPRIPWEGPGRCKACGAKPNKLHIIPCKLEESGCGEHQTCWECVCEYEKEV